MVDTNYTTIKQRMKRRSMELWGIENQEMVDPLIELFFDVFAFELSRVHQEIKISDAKLLERMAKILVNENWFLPTPSHALASAQPAEATGEIDKTTRLFYQKYTQGNLTNVHFTPIKKQTLIQASVYCTALERQLTFTTDSTTSKISIPAYKEAAVPEYTIWVGIDIDTTLLKKLNEIPIGIILRDSDLLSYVKMLQVHDYEGNALAISQEEAHQHSEKEHYYNEVHRYYQDYLYTIDLTHSAKKKHSLLERCNTIFNEEDIAEYDRSLFWLQLSFPVAFVKEALEKISISLNTFPIINRRLSYRQHDIKRNGKILSLSSLDDTYFLNVESLIDDNGKAYQDTLKNDIGDLSGSFSVYFGNLEQFDDRNAKFMLNQLIQAVREEGSSFSALGYDLLNANLEDLNERLDTLEQKVNYGLKKVSDTNEKVYLLTIPHTTSSSYECSYWTTNPTLGNGIQRGAALDAFKTTELIAGSIQLQTDTVGGVVKSGPKEKTSSFRYGLLAKDRIVSNEDIKEFITSTVGNTVKSVAVSSGVAISAHKKQGLVRTVHVAVALQHSDTLSSENKKRLSDFLQRSLTNKSVHNTPYRVQIITT